MCSCDIQVKITYKTALLEKGIAAIENESYRSSLSILFFHLVGISGHAQTFLSELKEQVRDNFLEFHEYDKRHLFTLSDGGQIYLDFMGKRF